VDGPFQGRRKVFRDPIHGDLAFPSRLWRTLTELVDTPAFQRLRLIRQNGLTNLVFPGTEHSRFAHSLGVAWTASQMLDAIERNSGLRLSDEQRDDTILAALLHDVGHGPFSHTLEEILKELGVDFDHEAMTKRVLLEPEAGVNLALESSSTGRAQRLVEFIDKNERTTTLWRHSIVSSQLDADRLDYVRRDAVMAGIDNHQPDVPRLIQNLGVVGDQVVVDSRALDVIESFLLALDHMYESVYFHKTVRGASLLLTATLKRAAQTIDQSISTSDDPLRAVITHGQDVLLKQYLRATDATVWVQLDRWRDSPDPTLRHLAGHMARRSFPRAIDYPDSVKAGEKLKAKAIELAREQVADVDPEYLVAIDEPERLSYKRYVGGEGSSQSIQTVHHGGSPRAIETDDRSIVSKVAKKFYKRRLFVPVEIRDDLLKFARHEGIQS
jgi:uncharacterized protein